MNPLLLSMTHKTRDHLRHMCSVLSMNKMLCYMLWRLTLINCCFAGCSSEVELSAVEKKSRCQNGADCSLSLVFE